jgi:pimeloyl-ACP methyl ester carboxylesterase
VFIKSDAYASVLRESSDVADSLLALFSEPRALETVARLELIPRDAPNGDRTEWHRIPAPTLVLATRRDPVHPFEYGQVLAREIPEAQFQELTPKCLSVERYTSELRHWLGEFLQTRFRAGASASRHLC